MKMKGRRLVVVGLTFILATGMLATAYADTADPQPATNKVQGQYDTTLNTSAGDVDFTINGMNSSPEGTSTYLALKYDASVLVKKGATNALLIGTNVVGNKQSSVRTTYHLSSTVPNAAGDHYRFSKNLFLGISMSDMVKSFSALSASEKATVGASDSSLIEYNDKTLMRSNAALKNINNAPAGWEYQVSDDGLTATITYTFTDADVAAGQECINGTVNGVIRKLVYAPVLELEKLDGSQAEASYFEMSETNSYIERHNGMTDFATYGRVYKRQYMTDKRGALISREIAPINSDGTVGKYQSSGDTIWLDPKQKARIRVTVTRPYGVVNTKKLELSDYIADNFKYTDGFTYVKDSLNVNLANAPESAVVTDKKVTKSDWLTTLGENASAEEVNNGILNMYISKLKVGDSATYTYEIQAPDTVDDPGTSKVEHERLFYSNTNMINEYQRTLVYKEVDLNGYVWEWKDKIVEDMTGGAKTVGDTLYDRSEWLLKTQEFVLGLKDNQKDPPKDDPKDDPKEKDKNKKSSDKTVKANSTKTGDENDMGLWLILAACGVIGTAGTVAVRRKKHNG